MSTDSTDLVLSARKQYNESDVFFSFFTIFYLQCARNRMISSPQR